MPVRLLDVSILPFEQTFVCDDKSEINLKELLESFHETIQALMAEGLIKKTENFGFAMTAPMWEGDDDGVQEGFWDQPEEYVHFVGGWGPERNRYIANAVRKLRPLLRPVWDDESECFVHPCESTLEMRFFERSHFQDKVAKVNDDGTFPWGDFPYGGAAFIQMGDLILGGACSAYTEIEDDMVTKLVLGGIAKQIVIGNQLMPLD